MKKWGGSGGWAGAWAAAGLAARVDWPALAWQGCDPRLLASLRDCRKCDSSTPPASWASSSGGLVQRRAARSLDEARPALGGGPGPTSRRWAGRPEGRGCWPPKGSGIGGPPCPRRARKRLTVGVSSGSCGAGKGKYIWRWFGPRPAWGGLSHRTAAGSGLEPSRIPAGPRAGLSWLLPALVGDAPAPPGSRRAASESLCRDTSPVAGLFSRRASDARATRASPRASVPVPTVQRVPAGARVSGRRGKGKR